MGEDKKHNHDEHKHGHHESSHGPHHHHEHRHEGQPAAGYPLKCNCDMARVQMLIGVLVSGFLLGAGVMLLIFRSKNSSLANTVGAAGRRQIGEIRHESVDEVHSLIRKMNALLRQAEDFL